MISVITVSVRPDRLDLVEKSLKKQTIDGFEWIVEDYADNSKPWSFNKATNLAIKKAHGDLIIFIQDSIWFAPTALSKFEYHYQQNPLACISGVGDQYDQLDENGKPTHKVWEDPRKNSNNGTFYECYPNDWEINFASVPKKLLYDIGGFDETMDDHFGMDNVAVAHRLDQIGAKFYLDQTNESYTLRHGRRDDWDSNHWMNHNFNEFLANRPVKLDYLS